MIKNEPQSPSAQAFQQMLMQIYGPQQVTPFTGDWSTYGQTAGEHQFFRPGPAPGASPLPSPGGLPPSPGAGPATDPLTAARLLAQLREGGTGQKLDVRGGSGGGPTRTIRNVNKIDKILRAIQDPLGTTLGAVGLENPLGMSNFGVTGLLSAGGRLALQIPRNAAINQLVAGHAGQTSPYGDTPSPIPAGVGPAMRPPQPRTRETYAERRDADRNFATRAEQATKTHSRIGGPV